MMADRRSKKLILLIFKNDACSLAMGVAARLSFKNFLTLQMVVHLFFALTMPISWIFLFPMLCWSINTKSMITPFRTEPKWWAIVGRGGLAIG
jgi:hypothetical protein